MTRYDDQESQVVEPLVDTAAIIPSSPPTASLHGVPLGAQDGSHMGSDDALPDRNNHEPGVQHESVGGCIEETQFVGLYPETQNVDEPQPSFRNPTGLSPAVTTGTSDSTARPMSSPYVTTIERPKVCDPADNAGFKFRKAQKAPTFGFGRDPGKATDFRTNTTQPVTSAVTSKRNPLPPTQSNAPHVPLPSKPMQNQTLLSSEKTRAPSGINHGKNAGPPTHTGAVQTISTEPVMEKYREPSRRRVLGNVKATNTQMPEPAPALESPTAKKTQSHPDQQFPHKAGLKAANKSNKRSSTKQAFPPFPDVLEPPRDRNSKGGTTAANRQTIATVSHPLQSLDVNGQLLDRTHKQNSELTREDLTSDQDDTNEPIETIINGQGSRPYALSISQKNAQQTVVRDDPAPVEGANIQVDPMLPLAANVHHNEAQREWPQVPDQLEQTLIHHHPDDHREALHRFDTHKSPMGPVDLRSESDGELHHSVQPPFQPPSRPQSVLSNTARSMVRPLVADELLPQGVLEHPILHFKQPMKIQKWKSGPTHVGQRSKSNSEHINQRTKQTSAPSSVQAFRRNWVQIEEVLEDYENQKSLIESQQGELESQAAELELQQKRLESQQSKLESRKAEIKELKLAAAESNEQIKRLEEEKAALSTKIQKFTEISAKYKAHMNDVVVAQKHLMAESSKIKADSTKIREEAKAILKVRADRESHENKLRSLINNAKSIPPMVEKLAELEEENTKVKGEIENLKQTNVLLQSDLNARLVDLGRERHNTEQLQKNLNAQNESHKELVEVLNKAQSTIVDELTKEGGVLANLVNSENSIQAKIDELSAFVNAVNSREPDLPPALIKLIEDLYTRIEDKLQAAENNDISLNESSLKLFEDLKERISQLRLDDGAKASLNERISELRESNATLTAGRSARDLECQRLSKRVDELGRELSGCRDQLTAKSDELAALRALPKQDAILLGKIQELENARTILQGQLNTSNQEASKAKEELVSHRDMALSAQGQSEELQSKLTETQTSLKTLVEEKKKYVASHKAEVDKARQEIAKSANASKIEAQLKHDCLAKNLEQRRSEAEKELGLVQEELQKSEEEKASYSKNLNKLQEELSACNKQLAQQAVYIKHADQLNLTRDELDRRERNLQQALKDMTELKAHFDAVQNEISKKVEGLVGHQQQAEKLIRRVDLLENENIVVEEQTFEIQKTHEAFRNNVSRYLRRSGALLGEQPVDAFVAAISVQSPRKMGPPAAPMSKIVTTRTSHASSDITPSHSRLSDDQSFSSGLSGTPKVVRQRNEQKHGLSTQRTADFLYDNDATSSNNLRTKSRAITGATIPSLTKAVVESSIHFQSSSPYQATPKPLRPANRKSGGLAQFLQIEKSLEFSQRVSASSSALDHVPSRTPLTSHTPTNMTQSSAESSLTSSIHSSRGFEQPRASAPNAVSSIIDVYPPTDTPLSAAQVLTSSSSLSELSMVDELGYNDKEFLKVHLQGKEMKSGQSVKEGTGEIPTPVQSLATGVVHFKATPSSFQFSDGDALSVNYATKSVHHQVPSLTEESVRRRLLVPLKSALRKSGQKQASNSANDSQGDIYQIPDSITAATTSPKPSSRVTANNKQQPKRGKSTIGSSYNRVVSGSKPDSISQSSGLLSLAQRRSAANPTVGNSERSPLMKAPARLARKRSASMSEVKSQPMKPFKQARVSLPNQGQRISRTVIPDSQEAANYRH